MELIWGRIKLNDDNILDFKEIPRELIENQVFLEFVMKNSYNKAKIYEVVEKYINYFKEHDIEINDKFDYLIKNFKKL